MSLMLKKKKKIGKPFSNNTSPTKRASTFFLLVSTARLLGRAACTWHLVTFLFLSFLTYCTLSFATSISLKIFSRLPRPPDCMWKEHFADLSLSDPPTPFHAMAHSQFLKFFVSINMIQMSPGSIPTYLLLFFFFYLLLYF